METSVSNIKTVENDVAKPSYKFLKRFSESFPDASIDEIFFK